MAAIVGALNPLGFVASLIRDHKLNEWLKLLISLAVSGTISFLFSGGSTIGSLMLAKVSPAYVLLGGLGSGMVSAAVMMTVTWRRSPLTKGLIIALPQEEANQEIESGAQVISK